MPTPVQTNSFDVGNTSATSIAVGFANPQTLNNCNLVCIYAFKSGGSVTVNSVTDTNGNVYTLVGAQNNYQSGNTMAVYSSIGILGDSGGNTVTVNFSVTCTFRTIIIAEYPHNNCGAVDIFAWANANSAGPADSGPITTSFNNELLCGFVTISGNNYSSAGTGWTAEVVTTTNKMVLEDQITGLSGVFDATATLTSAAAWGSLIVAFVPSFPPLPPVTNEVRLTGTLLGTPGSFGSDPTTTITSVTDGSQFTVWVSPNPSGDWVGIDAGATCQLSRARITARGGAEDLPIGAYIQSNSSDPTFSSGNQHLMTVGSRLVTGLGLNDFVINPFVLGRYYRFYSTSHYGSLGDLDFIVQYTTGINAACVAPTVSPPGGLFDFPVVVRLACITTSANIYYTLDGSTPTSSSTKYTGPFIISTTCTINAIAIDLVNPLGNSRITSYPFTIPSAIISVNNAYDINRSYRVWDNSSDFKLDPVGKRWYRYTVNYDQKGVGTEGAIGMNIYSSNDMRNWKYENTSIVPNPGGANETNTTYVERPKVVYNKANNNYILWIHFWHTAPGLAVYSSPSPTGPWTFFTKYTTLDGVAGCDADCTIFIDDDGTTAYLVRNGGSSDNVLFISTMTSDYKNTTTPAVTYTNNASSPFGQKAEGMSFFKRNGVYFWMCSTTTIWQPNKNLYVTSTSPLGPWSAPKNAFQPTQSPGALGLAGVQYASVPITQNNIQNFAYDGQSLQFMTIPGRGDNWHLILDRYDCNLDSSTELSTVFDMRNHKTVHLPVTFIDNTTMQFNWQDAWTFDGTFPTVSGAPLPASNLSVTKLGLATWTNNEPNPASVYLDTAVDQGFLQVASEVLPEGSTSFQTVLPARYYRVRTVNANGTAYSPIFTNLPPAIAYPCFSITPSRSKGIQYLQVVQTGTSFASNVSSIVQTLNNVAIGDYLVARVSWQASDGKSASVSDTVNGSYIAVPGATQVFYNMTVLWFYVVSAAGSPVVTATLGGTEAGVVLEVSELLPWEIYTAVPGQPPGQALTYYPGGPQWNNLNVIQNYIEKFIAQSIYLTLPHPVVHS